MKSETVDERIKSRAHHSGNLHDVKRHVEVDEVGSCGTTRRIILHKKEIGVRLVTEAWMQSDMRHLPEERTENVTEK